MKRFFMLGCVIAMSISCFADASPNDGRIARAEYVSSLIKPGDIAAEIGVASGVFAYPVLLQKNPLKLYLIDP